MSDLRNIAAAVVGVATIIGITYVSIQGILVAITPIAIAGVILCWIVR